MDQADCDIIYQYQGERLKIKNIANHSFQCLNNDGNIISIESEKIYKCQNLLTIFPKHIFGFQFHLKIEQQQFIYEIEVLRRSRFIFQSLSEQNLLLRRFILLKQEQNDCYEIIWGIYQSQNILQSLILQKGVYILLPLPGGQLFNIYFEDRQYLHIKKSTKDSLKTFNLLKKAFQQCRSSPKLKRTMTLLSDDEGTIKQYWRTCYMNYGLIIEYYENIYEFQAKFMNQDQKRQDIELLFSSIYSESQLQNRLYPGEKIFKFYQIISKPANIFIPKKKVLMRNRLMQNLTIHSIFK